MKIGIVGPPDSGKSALAKGIAEHLEGEVDIVDDYIPEIEEYCDFELNYNSTYIGNLYVVLGRYARERQANQTGNPHRITCGTFLDSAIYASLQAVGTQTGSTTELLWERVSNFMQIVGTFYQDTYEYNQVFVTKYDSNDTEAIRHPAWISVNDAIDMALNSFGVQYVTLQGSPEERLKQATEVLDQANVEDEVAQAD